MDYKKEAKSLETECIAIRRDIHRHPELGFQEFRTAGIIRDYLKSIPLDEVKECSGTGTIGILHGSKPGPTVMIRADIDALPILEQSGEPFSSETPGVMHACGHDGHTAMLLCEAKILAAHRDEIPGTIAFVFQPNEEDAGAQIMIDDGAMEMAGHPEAAFGLHLKHNYPFGTIAICPGPMMASSYYFKLTIQGKGGHGGYPHLCINPIVAAAHVIENLESFRAFENSVFEPTVISVGMIHAGEKNIVIPNDIELEGSIRCLHRNHEHIHRRFCEVVEQTCSLYHCTCDIELKCGNSLVYNDPALEKLAEEAAVETVGGKNLLTENIAVMGGDDMAEFMNDRPGIYFFVGMGDPSKGTDCPNHNDHFRLNEDSLAIGMEMTMRLVLKYMEQQAAQRSQGSMLGEN